nr:synaptobrevin, longin-like domain protein [Tanacetum cinerariifolium]
SVAVKKVNDMSRLQALVDRKKVIITEAIIRDALHLDDAEGIECLPNEEIFTELARMGYEKPSTKLTFYKVFFSSQWKFLIHTILLCMSTKRTLWNEFSSSMASAVICLSTGRKFNFSKYIFDRVGKGCFGVETPLFEGMIVAQQVGKGAAEVNVEDVSTAGVTAEGAASAADDEVLATVNEPSIPSPPPPTQPPPPSQDIPSTSQGRIITNMDADRDVTLKDVAAINLEHADKVLNMQDVDIEPAELQEVVEVVTTAKLITEVVTVASTTITAAASQLTIAAASTLTTALSAARRRKGVVIRNPEESATPSTIIHIEANSKDKGKWIMKEDNVVKMHQALKNKPQTKAQSRKNMMIYLRNMAGFKMNYFKGMTYDDIRPIFEKKFNSSVAFLQKTKEQIDEEDSRALKRLSETQEEKAAKKTNDDGRVSSYDDGTKLSNDDGRVFSYDDGTKLCFVYQDDDDVGATSIDENTHPRDNVSDETNLVGNFYENSEFNFENKDLPVSTVRSFGVDATEDFKENMLSD